MRKPCCQLPRKPQPQPQLLLAGALLLGLVANLAAAQGSTDAARAFCASPAAKNLKCGWANEASETAVAAPDACLWCGTYWTAPVPDQLPVTYDRRASQGQYGQAAGRVISLGCSGRVVVRAVFKYIAQPPSSVGLNSSAAGLVVGKSTSDGTPSDVIVIRCKLQLPSGPGPEAARATAAKETDCYTCTPAPAGGCPNVPGTWYSDSYTTTVNGCGSGGNLAGGYDPNKPGIFVDYGAALQLVKFEVCSDPGCFDPAYEDKKAASAKKCVTGVCLP